MNMKQCVLIILIILAGVDLYACGGNSARRRLDVENVKVVRKEELSENFCLLVLSESDTSNAYVAISSDSSFYKGIMIDSSYSFVLEEIRLLLCENWGYSYFGEMTSLSRVKDSCFVFKDNIQMCLEQTDRPFIYKIVPEYKGEYQGESDSIPHVGNRNYRLKGKTAEIKTLRYFLDVIVNETPALKGLRFQTIYDYYGWKCFRIYDYYNRKYGVNPVDDYPNRWGYMNHSMPFSSDFSRFKIRGISKWKDQGNIGVISITKCWEYMGNLNACIQLFHVPNQKFYYIIIVMDSEGYPIEYSIEEDSVYGYERIKGYHLFQ